MITLYGTSVFQGISIGKILFYERSKYNVDKKTVHNVDAEIKRFELAKESALLELQELNEMALSKANEINAAIFEGHQLILQDEGYYNFVIDLILNQGANAEFAVKQTSEKYSQMFLSMKDEYMQARAFDIIDVSERLLRLLNGDKQEEFVLNEPVILAADDLIPSETIRLDKNKVLGFAIMYGSENSHTAIIAKALNIPAIIGIGKELTKEYNNRLAIIDGISGTLYIDPDANTLEEMKKKQKELLLEEDLLTKLVGKDNVTIDGKRVDIYGNISNLSDVDEVLKNDGGGIGLFRSEFLYLERDTYPSEEEQFLVYKEIAKAMNGKKVIIRTLDIGADKKIDYFGLEKEENPAMGFRGIRICLTRTEIFKTQLRAILRASMYGTISIMLPMIISVSEVRKAKDILEEVKMELIKEHISFKNDIEIGIMIETPAAVMISDELAKEVDFFSVGTNDLTQYTLAIDRQNTMLDTFFDAHHPAILKMLHMVVKNAHENGIWAGICGELASDLTITRELLQMGYDELSVSPSMILRLRKKVRELKLS
ncbi:phosphoenolpyruvate--protein phosphotransferase [Clostridium sp. Marseille-P299]|uniref:phosphoenolpyruvate--protein phosphotransferase n=1 Tax=Clostridium sp. Marseille-P299 TaxID=1805477 RepID=UPI000836D3E6|nr:phosphoenolpyruvate--protein phosphotransferase [Clostridium sp. Marseille-P299]